MSSNIIKKEKDKIIKKIKYLRIGDTIEVNLWIVEGSKKRIQKFDGIIIAIHRNNINSTFTVRKISYGEGMERIFFYNSPIIESIIVIRSGVVRKSKIYYLRNLKGKAARIKERINK